MGRPAAPVREGLSGRALRLWPWMGADVDIDSNNGPIGDKLLTEKSYQMRIRRPCYLRLVQPNSVSEPFEWRASCLTMMLSIVIVRTFPAPAQLLCASRGGKKLHTRIDASILAVYLIGLLFLKVV